MDFSQVLLCLASLGSPSPSNGVVKPTGCEFIQPQEQVLEVENRIQTINLKEIEEKVGEAPISQTF